MCQVAEGWCGAVQVVDTKGMHLAYPKVALQTPFRDNMDTTGAGAQHQELLGFSPCSAEQVENAIGTAAAAAADVVYFYKPQADCRAAVSACSSVMATELAVFSGVDNVRTPGLDLENASAIASFANCVWTRSLVFHSVFSVVWCTVCIWIL